MSAHTPGPWTFDEHGGAFYVWGPGMAMVADGDPKNYVARMRGIGRGATTDEQRANARLIAAAPDLLEVLRRFVDLADLEYLGTEARAVHAAKVARAAIAKAEGR